MKRERIFLFGVGFLACAALIWGLDFLSSDTKAGAGELLVSPTDARERDFYAPNSEDLAPGEIRVIACGTGMPTPRPAQAAACFLMELGNGEKFIFDIGDGAAERPRHWSPIGSHQRGVVASNFPRVAQSTDVRFS